MKAMSKKERIDRLVDYYDCNQFDDYVHGGEYDIKRSDEYRKKLELLCEEDIQKIYEDFFC